MGLTFFFTNQKGKNPLLFPNVQNRVSQAFEEPGDIRLCIRIRGNHLQYLTGVHPIQRLLGLQNRQGAGHPPDIQCAVNVLFRNSGKHRDCSPSSDAASTTNLRRRQPWPAAPPGK